MKCIKNFPLIIHLQHNISLIQESFIDSMNYVKLNIFKTIDEFK